MRLNRYLAASGVVSRRQADSLISAGRVLVNGRAGSLGQTVAPGDVVTLDGKPVQAPATHRYLAVHKPAGYISSRRRQGTSPIVYELLPAELRDLRLAGRLDRESSGLLLLSDDGEFIQAMSHPSADKQKIYEVDVDRAPSPGHLAELERGVKLADGPSVMHVLAADGRRLTLALEEGRNRQIRRTLGALGYAVTRLHRTRVGDYELGDLPSGQWREVKS